MTDLSVMLRWYAPECETKSINCCECGAPLTATRGAGRMLCEQCRAEADHKKYMKSKGKVSIGNVLYYRYGDPTVDLVYAVINQAIHDRIWGCKGANSRYAAESSDLDINECDAGEFIEDGGAELWLRSLGIGVTQDMRRKIRLLSEGEEI